MKLNDIVPVKREVYQGFPMEPLVTSVTRPVDRTLLRVRLEKSPISKPSASVCACAS